MQVEPFNQPPPELADPYETDALLKEHLERVMPKTTHDAVVPSLRAMAGKARELYQLLLAHRAEEPTLTQWDAWGNRIDQLEVTTVWKLAERVAAEHGVVAAAYDKTHGRFARLHQAALAYLYTPSSAMFSCPLAMTDGAAATLLSSGNQELINLALPRLTTTNPDELWTSGQWMTESTGGSDVGLSETVAKEIDGQWRLYGRKWFTSAAASQVALTLGRPEGNPAGGRGLALFFIRCHDESGRLRNIRVNRLKEKLGTRQLPTAELMLEGTPASLVNGTTNGVRNITPMLNITRTWNAITSVSMMRRGISLARDYARRRVAFGAKLSNKPLHIDTLAGMQSEFEGAFALTFYIAELLGKAEHNELDAAGQELLRLLTPITKLTTAKQAVAVSSEVLEAFGGAGYVEDTGLPSLLRDAQVLSIWEGTTNVLSLDAIRATSKGDALRHLGHLLSECHEATQDPALRDTTNSAVEAFEAATQWLKEVDPAGIEAGARRFALTLGRATELALVCRHAQWALDQKGDRRARAAALRLAQSPLMQIAWLDEGDSRLLAG